MTDREFWLRISRLAARLEPDLAREFLRAVQRLRAQLPIKELVEALETSGVERILSEHLGPEQLEQAFARFRAELQRTVTQAVQLSARNVPGAQVGHAFGVLNPLVLQAARELDTRVMQSLSDQVRETFRAQMEAGLQAGVNPREIARAARDRIGLARNQVAAIENFRRMLEEGDREALTRELRDKRFDRPLQRALGARGAGLTPEQIDRMVAAYERRMIAFNAETHTRTAALDAMKAGQRLAWEDAIRNGVVDRSRLFRRWSSVGDSRVRREHELMDGEEAHFDRPYSNGEIVPGETTWNCRCLDRYFIRAEAAA